MKLLNRIIAICITAASLTACGNDDSFSVNATVDGLGTQNVRIYYREGDRVHSLSAMALDGKFSFSGVAKKPVLAEIYTGSRALLGSVVVQNGDNLELTLKLNEPGTMTAKGNRISEQLAKFHTDNREVINSQDLKEINRLVANYVKRNYTSPAAGYLLLSMFTPALDSNLADSLVMLLDEKAIPAYGLSESFKAMLVSPADTVSSIQELSFYALDADSLEQVSFPGSKGLFMALVGTKTPGATRDSVTSYFNALQKKYGDKLEVIEISMLEDTAACRKEVANLKPRYTYAWLPAGLASPSLESLRPASIPWFFVTDSTGTVLYTGPIFQDAVDRIPR